MKFSPILFIVFCALSCGAALSAEPARSSGSASAEYAVVAEERSKKIVGALELKEPAKAVRVQAIIAQQYQSLHDIHATRDQQVAAAKSHADAAMASARTTAAHREADEAIKARHTKFLAELGAELTPVQIDGVKDGMTYGVVPLTFKVYQQMMPDLTAEQKRQILDWLKEARELAMDAGSSKEKHAWFGKYKGRINNYLSAAGIDMKAAEKNLTRKP